MIEKKTGARVLNKQQHIARIIYRNVLQQQGFTNKSVSFYSYLINTLFTKKNCILC